MADCAGVGAPSFAKASEGKPADAGLEAVLVALGEHAVKSAARKAAGSKSQRRRGTKREGDGEGIFRGGRGWGWGDKN